MFGEKKKQGVINDKTEEGYKISQQLLVNGYVSDTEVSHYPGVPNGFTRKKGIIPVIECTQNIPCNPCQDACVKGCIKVGDEITRLPIVDENVNCTGCGMCVTSCPGQAIFLVDESYLPGYATVSLPYEILPLPKENDKGIALDRSGKELGEATVIKVRTSKVMDQTAMLTIQVPVEWSMKARFFVPKV